MKMSKIAKLQPVPLARSTGGQFNYLSSSKYFRFLMTDTTLRPILQQQSKVWSWMAILCWDAPLGHSVICKSNNFFLAGMSWVRAPNLFADITLPE